MGRKGAALIVQAVGRATRLKKNKEEEMYDDQQEKKKCSLDMFGVSGW